jgi:hypothetical protein
MSDRNYRPSAPPYEPEQRFGQRRRMSVNRNERHPQAVEMDELWVSFFNMCYETAEDAVKNGWVSVMDIEDSEPYLFYGLTGKTILEAIFRSWNREGIQMAIGNILTAENCPHQHRDLYVSLEQIKTMLKALNMEASGKDELRKIVLYGNSNHEFKSNLTDAQSVAYHRAAAVIQDVSIQVSQLSFFKQQFQNIFSLLLMCLKADDAGD